MVEESSSPTLAVPTAEPVPLQNAASTEKNAYQDQAEGDFFPTATADPVPLQNISSATVNSVMPQSVTLETNTTSNNTECWFMLAEEQKEQLPKLRSDLFLICV